MSSAAGGPQVQPRQRGVSDWLVADDALLVRGGRQEVHLLPDSVLATVDGHLALELEGGAVVLAAGEVL